MTVASLSPTPHHPHPGTDRLLSTPGGADGSSAVDSAVSGQVLFGIAVLVAWVAVGFIVALVVSRRGHDLASAAALGFLLGPVLAAYAASTGVRREQATPPLVVAAGTDLDGEADVLIAVLGDADDVTDALPSLWPIGDRLRRVTLVRPVTFETAGESDEVTLARRRDAADVLSRAAGALPGVAPRMVLVPGRPARAVVDYAAEHCIDHIVVVGDPADQAAVDREGRARGRRVELTAPSEAR